MYIVWGSTYLAIRYAVETIPPFLMVGMRFLVSGVLLYAWARFRGAPRPTRVQWRDAAITGVLMLCCGNGAVSWAEQRVPSGLAALLVAVVPLWMVIIDWARPARKASAHDRHARSHRRLGRSRSCSSVPATDRDTATVDATAAIVLVLASLAWAAGSVYNRFGALPESAAMSTGLQMISGSIVLVVMGMVAGEVPRAAYPQHLHRIVDRLDLPRDVRLAGRIHGVHLPASRP